MEENRRALTRLEAERRQAAQAGGETEALDRQIAEARENLAGQEEIVELIEGRGEEVEIITGWGWLDKAVRKAAANPSLLFYKMQANAYKFSWALIPISVPFVWLLFLNRRRYRRSFGAYDHVVFVTYSIAFMSLALIAFVALRSIGIQSGLLTAAFLLVPPLHIYRHLKGAYGLSRWSAAWRTIAVLVFANTALTLFLLLLLTLGALG